MERPERPTWVHLTPAAVAPEALAGGVVIVIDALRASVTIAAALAAGAPFVRACLSVEEARGVAAEMRAAGERPLLGGERGGVRIEGFDLDNSPRAYTRGAIDGRPVVFTTTNGTAAMLHAAGADEVIVGSLANVSAVCEAVREEARAVHILCAGTRGEVSLDDCLPAGAMIERLVAGGRGLASDDSARLCAMAWRATGGEPAAVRRAMEGSRGGRNLLRLGMAEDVAFCSVVDAVAVVPVFHAATRRVTLRGGPGVR